MLVDIRLVYVIGVCLKSNDTGCTMWAIGERGISELCYDLNIISLGKRIQLKSSRNYWIFVYSFSFFISFNYKHRGTYQPKIFSFIRRKFQAREMLQQIYGVKNMLCTRVLGWHKRFQEGSRRDERWHHWKVSKFNVLAKWNSTVLDEHPFSPDLAKLEINPKLWKCTEMKNHKFLKGWFYLLNYLPTLNVSVFRLSSGGM